MGQITIQLDDVTEQKITEAAKSAQISKSTWITQVICEKVAAEWPQSVIDMAGTWQDFPSLDAIRQTDVQDVEQEAF